MTLSYFWYQVIFWVLIAQMITGFLKAFVGLCVPRVEYWLLGGFDLAPWKTDRKIRRDSEPVDEDSEPAERRNKSFINRIKHFFSGFSQFKYQPLRAEVPQYQRSAVFTLNLVVGVILPIKFGLQLARLPLEPCIAACRRQWPLKRKIRRQNGSVVEMDDNHFDGNTGRSHSTKLGSKPPYAETESTNLHKNPSKVLSRPVVFNPNITGENQSQNHGNSRSGKATPYISRTTNPRPDLADISDEPSVVSDKPSRTAKKNRTQSDIRQPLVHNQSLPEHQPQNMSTTSVAPSHDVQSHVSKGETSSEKTVSEEFGFCSLIHSNHKNRSPPEESPTNGRSNVVEAESWNPTRKPCVRQTSPVLRPQYRRRTGEDSESRLPKGQHSSRQHSARSVSTAADKGPSRDLEPRVPRKQILGFQQPIVYPLPIAEKCVQCIPVPRRRVENLHRCQNDLRFVADRLTAAEDDVSTRDSAAQVAFHKEAHKARNQRQLTKDEDTETPETNRGLHQARHERPPSADVVNIPSSNVSEMRRRSMSPNRPIFQGVPVSQTRWRSFHRVDTTPSTMPPTSWHNQSAAALVQSLDAVESGTFKCAQLETDIVFSTADPEEQALMDQRTSFSGDRNALELAAWCRNSSENDSRRVQSQESRESAKGEVVAGARSPERPLGFTAVLGTESEISAAVVSADQLQLGLNPFSAAFDTLTKQSSNGQLLAPSLSALPSSPQSPSAEEPPTRFHSYLKIMPTVEEENTDDNLAMRRLARKRSSSGSKRTPHGSQENSSCSRSSRMAKNNTTKAKAYKIADRNPSKLSRLGYWNYDCVTDRTTVGTGDSPPRPGRRSKPEKARKPSRKDAKSHRKKIEGGVLPEETVRASTSGTHQQDVIHSVLSTVTLPLTISNHANACVSTSDDLCLHARPSSKLAIKRSHSFPNPHAQPKRASQSLNKASSEPNVTTHTGTQNDMAKFLLLIKWSKEYYSTNKNTTLRPALARDIQLPLVAVHSKELVVRHMSEEVQTVVRSFSEHSQLDYCPASKAPSSDRFDVSTLEEKASKLPYELEALIHRPLLENVGVIPEPFDPCSMEEISYLRHTTQPPLTPEVNMDAVLGHSAPPIPPPRRGTSASSPHFSSPRPSAIRLPLSSLFPDLPPLPAPRSSPFLPPAAGPSLPASPFEPRSPEDTLLPSLQAVLDDIESELMHPFQSVLRGRYNSTLRKIRSGPTSPLPAPGYYPNFQSYLPWEANQFNSLSPGQCLPEINQRHPSNFQQTEPTSHFSSRTAVWNGIEPLIQYPNELLTSERKQLGCNSKKNETYSSVKHFESVLALQANSTCPSSTQSEKIIRSTLPPQAQASTLPKSYPPSCPYIPTWDNTRTGLPTTAQSFNHLQYPNQPSNLHLVNPVNVLAGLEKATKRANDILSKTSPIANAHRFNIKEATTSEQSQATPGLIAATPESNRNEYLSTAPIICLTTEAPKQTDFMTPSTSTNSRLETSKKRAPVPQPVDRQASTPAGLKRETVTKRSSNEFQARSDRNHSTDTVSRPNSFLLELPSKQKEQLPTTNASETTPRNSNDSDRTSVIDTSTIQHPYVPMPTDCLDNETRKTLLANYKEFHKRQMMQMRENINNYKPAPKYAADIAAQKTNNCNPQTGNSARAKTDPDSKQLTDTNIASCSGTITLLPCTPVIALMQAPQMQEASSVESMLLSRKERSHKNLSSLLEKELNLDSGNAIPHKRKRTRLRKRARPTAAPSSSETAHHKPSRTRTVRRPSQEQAQSYHKQRVAHLKGPIRVKVKCTRSFSYFTVKERYKMVSASSSSNSDRR